MVEPEEQLNPGEFNLKTFYYQQNIHAIIFLDTNHIYPTALQKGSKLLILALNLRQERMGYLKRIFKNEQHVALLGALILGTRTELDQNIINAFSYTGTIHALSVSGMHVGLIYVVLKYILLIFT